jgi:DNA transposition AAA+ family ATPase
MISTLDAETETSSSNAHVVPASAGQTALATLPDPQSASLARRYNIPGDVVNKATAELPDHQRAAVRWLHWYCAEKNIAYKDIAQKLRRPNGDQYDGNTIYRILTGRYEGEYDRVVKSILDFKRLADERATVKRLPFIATNLSRRIFKICEAALIYQKIAFVSSDGQVGKTTAAMEYQRTHNHGQTIYVRMPAGGSLCLFKKELARQLRISPQLKSDELTERVLGAFDENILLIVDEVHQAFGRYFRLDTIEFIREIHDRKRCGIVLIDTNILPREIREGAHREMLAQLDRRSLLKLALPTRPTAADLEAIAGGYNLARATGEALTLQTEIIRDHGLGVWCTYLQAASRFAEKEKKTLAWPHVIKARDILKKLESPNLD